MINWKLSAGRIRAWVTRHTGLFLAGVLLAYLAGFLCYQAWSPGDAIAWQRSARYRVGDRCWLLVEYPERVRHDLATVQPITLRLWTGPDSSPPVSDPLLPCSSTLALAAPITYVVQLGPTGGGLEFTDAAGQLGPASVSAGLALSESEAQPVRLFVRQAPMARAGPSPLHVAVQALDAAGSRASIDAAVEGQSPPTIDLESAGELRLRHVLKVLFATGPLQWLFTALGGLLGVWEAYRALQQKREERREKAVQRQSAVRDRIAALNKAESAAGAFQTYLTLRSELSGDADLLEVLRGAFQPEWLPYLRLQIGRMLRAEQLDGARAAAASMAWEWRQAAGAHTLDAVHAMIDCLQRPTAGIRAETLQVLLDGFQAVGLSAAGPVVRRLAQAGDTQLAEAEASIVEDVLLSHGGAGGHYLLSRWAEQDEHIKSRLGRWERQSLPALSNPSRAAALWPRHRGEPRAVQAAVRTLGLDFNPFGPDKAEQDPRLPDLFYCVPSTWDRLLAPSPGLFIAPPGSGRTALLWMVRFESGLAGSDLERVLPVWVPLYGFSTAQELATLLHKALAAALCNVIARDPYALLGLDAVGQQSLADLLFQAYGGLAPLQQQLRRAGLRTEEPDGRLLQESLGMMDRPGEQAGTLASWDLPRLCPYGTDYVFFLVDAACPDPAMIDTLVEHLFVRWPVDLGPRHMVPKVFVPAPPATCPIEPHPLTWDKQELAAMLRFRLERAGFVAEASRPILEGWVEGLDLETELLERAAGSPARLIQLGNRLIERLAGSLPLSPGQVDRLFDA